MRLLYISSWILSIASPAFAFQAGPAGSVYDPQGKPVAGAVVRLLRQGAEVGRTRSGAVGEYALGEATGGEYTLRAESPGLATVEQRLTLPVAERVDLAFRQIAAQSQSLVITANSLEPAIDLRNAEVFTKTLFTRDDQALQQLSSGIDAGQHEGGGKSLEIRRFGFNLDHGGVNGGLKVLVDGVQQNQGTQGHGQGYLGALKSMTPELIEEVTVVNGPFSPEYGDFSGLGVVHMRQRESLPDRFTVRLQGGNHNARRAFLAWSPDAAERDAYIAYEGSYTDGPFENPGRYRRDNVNSNYTRPLTNDQKLGFRFLFGRNNFYSSGQLPLDLIEAGTLDRFGYLDPTEGGRGKLGSFAGYYSKGFSNGATAKVDGFVGRSLADLYSNFTYYLLDPVNGDAFQQHDSRLQQGLNAQYAHPHRVGGVAASLTAGANFHDNQINVGLYPSLARVPLGVTARAMAHVTNGAGYFQEMLSLWRGRLMVGGGLRWDGFRYALDDLAQAERSAVHGASRWQGKANAALTPFRFAPLTLHWNYGRGINSADARAVAERPDSPRLAVTDFYQVGASANWTRLSLSADAFLIDHSHEQVYVPDDGSFEFKGPSRAYGYEGKLAVQLFRGVSLSGGMTKIGNAFFRGGPARVYVDSAPHFVGNAALTVARWRGWSGSLRMRAINRYRLDGEDPSIRAAGHTVLDLSVARQLTREIELNLSVDNLSDRQYYETQNYFESRVAPGAPAVERIHATPGYPLTAAVGITVRLGEK